MKKVRKLVTVMVLVAAAIGMIGCKPSPETSAKKDYGTCVVGDFILKDGSIQSKNRTPEADTVAAVIVRAKTDDKPALGVGIEHNTEGLAWCTTDAIGLKADIKDLNGREKSGYMDGRNSWEIVKAVCSDAEAHPEYYPAFNYSLTYAKTNKLTGYLETGWYLPTLAELKTIYQNKTIVEESLTKAGGKPFGSGGYWSCNQSGDYARLLSLDADGGDSISKNNTCCVCTVHVFE